MKLEARSGASERASEPVEFITSLLHHSEAYAAQQPSSRFFPSMHDTNLCPADADHSGGSTVVLVAYASLSRASSVTQLLLRAISHFGGRQSLENFIYLKSAYSRIFSWLTSINRIGTI